MQSNCMITDKWQLKTINGMHVDDTVRDTSYTRNITIWCELKVDEHMHAQQQ